MISIALCILIALTAYAASARSLVAGLTIVLAVGYTYGIARANLNQTGAYFLFDAAVAGFFMARLTTATGKDNQLVPRALLLWVALLTTWPLLLMALPNQDSMVQLVGLRGNVFLLPFLLIGAQLTDDRKYRLALWCAVLNILAFTVAAAEFTWGIDAFFPKNAVTSLIYQSNDVSGYSAYRIPGTFGNSHLYGGTMVLTLPFMLGAWLQPRGSANKALLTLALVATALGVFMSASRSHTVLLIVFLVGATLSARMTLVARAGWFVVLGCIAALVLSDLRLQRFSSVLDSGVVQARVGTSVNESFVKIALQYPLGNGLGGGGTSMPQFLQNRLTNPVLVENEYARIMIEQGIPGLLCWVAFISWLLTRRGREQNRAWRNSRRLAWVVTVASLVTSLIGTGLLTAVPQTALFLLLAGWLAADSSRTKLAPAGEIRSTA